MTTQGVTIVVKLVICLNSDSKCSKYKVAYNLAYSSTRFIVLDWLLTQSFVSRPTVSIKEYLTVL